MTSWSIRSPCAALLPRPAGAGTTSSSPPSTASAASTGRTPANGSTKWPAAPRQQNQQYLELMETPPFCHAAQIAHQIGWNAQLAQADPQAFAQFRQQLLDHGLRDEVAADRDEVRQAEAGRKQARTLRHAAGRARLPGRDPLHLPGAARQSARAGLRADAAWL